MNHTGCLEVAIIPPYPQSVNLRHIPVARVRGGFVAAAWGERAPGTLRCETVYPETVVAPTDGTALVGLYGEGVEHAKSPGRDKDRPSEESACVCRGVLVV